MQLIDLGLSDGSKSDGSNAWQVNAIKKEILIFDPTNKYTYCLISKFTLIAKKTRLIPKQQAKMIIEDDIIV